MPKTVEEKVIICVELTINYDPARITRDEVIEEAEQGLTNSLHQLASRYEIEGGVAYRLPSRRDE